MLMVFGHMTMVHPWYTQTGCHLILNQARRGIYKSLLMMNGLIRTTFGPTFHVFLYVKLHDYNVWSCHSMDTTVKRVFVVR